MITNAFIGRKDKPSDKEVAEVLGATRPLWDRLVTELAADHGVTTQEWKSYSPKAGWSLRLLRGKRTIVWMTPSSACFLVTFILGDKAMRTARESGFPARVLRILEEAPKYPEGTGIRLEIKGPRDLPAVKKLAAIKVAN